MEGDNTALAVANLLSLEQEYTLGFFAAETQTNDVILLAASEHRMWVTAGAFREVSHTKKGRVRREGKFIVYTGLLIDMKTTKETVCTLVGI